MANPFDDPDFGKTARKRNPFDDPDYRGPSVGPGPSALSRAGTYIDNLGRQFAQGGLMGFADEATSLADALADQQQPSGLASPLPDHGRTWGQSYDRALQRNRLRDDEFTKNNPVASGVAQVGGAVSTLPLTLAPRAATFLGRTLGGALTGAGYGGVAGFGHGKGGLDERLTNAGIGATGGALLGGALPAAASTAGFVGRGLRESRAGQWVGENLAGPAYDKTAALVEALAPRATPKNLSAAAPEGGQPIPVEGPLMRVADMLRNRAAASRDTHTRGAQERLAREFDRYGLDPQNVGRELMRMGDGAVLANAGGNATARLARTAYDLPGGASQVIDDALTAQRAGSPRRVQSAFEGSEPPPTVYEARQFLEANKGRVGGEVYPPAVEAAKGWTGGMGPQTPDIQRLMQVPAIREAFDQVTADAARLGRDLAPLEIAHLVKRQLNQNADAAFASGRAVNKQMVGGLADEWERALWTANPKLADADRAYAQAAQLPDLLEQGRQFLRAGTSDAATEVSPSALAATLPQLDDAGRLAFRVGSTNTARDIALTGPGPTRRLAGNIDENQLLQEKLVQIYGPERAAEIMRTAGAERSMLRTDAAIRGGPNTASKLAHMVDDGFQMPNVPTTMSAPTLLTRGIDAAVDWGRRQNAGNEPVRTALARMLMEGNPSANLQNLELIENLMRQRLAAQLRGARYGGGASSVGGGELGGAY